MVEFANVFLAGASRGVGREIALRLVQQSCRVVALARTAATGDELRSLGIEVVVGDAVNREAIAPLLQQSQPIQAIISTIGGVRDGQRSDFVGNRNLIDAAVQLGIPRFLLVSSIGSGESAVALPPQVLQTLKPALVEKEQAEQHLIHSGLTYTIIRPGGLKSEPATGQGALTPDPKVAGTIHRADVADLVCWCLHSPKAHNQVLSAVDRQMTYSGGGFEELSRDD